jgi:hypothetical protein
LLHLKIIRKGWGNMNATLVIVSVIVAFAVLIFVPQLLVRQSVYKVIDIFHKENALSPQTAKTAEDLKLAQKPLFQRMMTTRDYKPQALGVLVNAGIVMITEDGKLYLSEQALSNSALAKARIRN